MSPARKKRGPKPPARASSGRAAPRGGAPRGGAKRGAPKSGRKGAPPRTGGGRGVAPRTGRGGGSGAGRPTAPRGLGGDQVEGRQAVRELLLAGRRKVREISIEAGLDPSPILDDIVELAADQRVPVYEVGETKLRALARTESPQGVVALAQPLPEADLDELARRKQAFLLLFDGVTDPGNLGAALRSADGAGVTGVVLPRHRAAHIGPTVAKAAAGAIEHVPMALASGIPTAISRLRELGVWVVGLDAAGDRPIHELELGSAPIALVLGAEDRGLGRLVRQRCDQVARIPLRGQLASLNVSAATAVAAFEVRRQRDAAR